MTLMEIPTNPSHLGPLQWVLEHLNLAGWPMVAYTLYRMGRFLKIVEDRALTAEGHITKMATNEMPHMQTSLQDIQSTNNSMDESLKVLVKHSNRANNVARKRRK